jgi:hypothetical protein
MRVDSEMLVVQFVPRRGNLSGAVPVDARVHGILES